MIRKFRVIVLVTILFTGIVGHGYHAMAQTEIEFWWGETAVTEHMLALIDQFHELHPDIRVNLVNLGRSVNTGVGLDQLKAAIAAGLSPDVVWADMVRFLDQAVGENLYIPLDDVVDRDFLASIPFLPAPERYSTYQGRVLGLHFRTDARGLYYNQTFFEEAGLDARIGPLDIEELDLFASALTKFEGDGTVSRVGFTTRGDNLLETGWFWVFGGSVADHDTLRPTLTDFPAHLEALEWITSYADRYGPHVSAGSANFMSGNVAMFVQSTTWLNLFKEEAPNLQWWVSHIPYPSEGRKTTISSGYGAAIPRGAKNLKEAGEFIKFLAQAETQIEWFRRTRGVPARSDALLRLIQQGEITDPREVVMLELLPHGGSYPPLDSVIHPSLRDNVQRMREGKISPIQVLEDTQRAVEPFFKEYFGN